MESIKNKNILVIGGAGYVGAVLVGKLLELGYKVRVLDKLLYDNGSTINNLLSHNNFSFTEGDFGKNSDLNKALDNVTDVILLAALVGDPVCKKYPELTNKINLEYPKNLITKLNNRNISNFIFTSTCSNYGLIEDNTEATENHPLNPKSLYAETKVAFEEYILSNLNNIDYCPTILRLSTAFGNSPRMRFDLTVSEFTKDLALGNELLVYDENTWRPYCHIADISDAIINVLNAPKEKIYGEVFNVGGNQNNYTKKMIVELIQKHLENPVVNYKSGGFDPRNYRVSFHKIKNTLGFEPQISVEDSIIELIEAFNKNEFATADFNSRFYGNYSLNKSPEPVS